MVRHPLVILIPGCLAVLGLGALAVWLAAVPEVALEARVPGLDKPSDLRARETSAEPVELKGRLTVGEGTPSRIDGSWSRFRGDRFDNIYDEPTPLADHWDGLPPKMWSIEVGEGFASPVVRAGRVYMIDYDRDAKEDVVRCLSLDDGRDIWQFRYADEVKRNHGMSRTIPAVTDTFLVTIGPKCHVACLHPETGEAYWLIDLVQQYGTVVPPWYAGQCPLIDGDRVILAPGGPDVLMTALDAKTGETVWETPNPHGWKMTHSSIMPMTIGGRKTFVYCASGGVVGVDAETGELLWDTDAWKVSMATVPSPLVIDERRVFFCGGYNSGALMLELEPTDDGKFSPNVLYRLKPKEFSSTQQTPILYEGHIYGVREADKQLVCLDLDGKEVWASGSQFVFGLGPYMVVQDKIYAMDDEGLLTICELTPEAFRLVGQYQLLEGHDSWGPMTMVAGRLIVRDMTQMACYDMRAEAATDDE